MLAALFSSFRVIGLGGLRMFGVCRGGLHGGRAGNPFRYCLKGPGFLESGRLNKLRRGSAPRGNHPDSCGRVLDRIALH